MHKNFLYVESPADLFQYNTKKKAENTGLLQIVKIISKKWLQYLCILLYNQFVFNDMPMSDKPKKKERRLYHE